MSAFTPLSLRWTKRAEQELDAQIDYIADDNLSAAFRIRDTVHRHAQMLASTPHMGKTGRQAETRELVIAGTTFIIVYRVQGKSVDIIRLLHSAQNYPG